jgi:DNA polymerase-3 subunit epsilon
MNFIAIDFETSNPCLESICQIGVVVFDGNGVADVWQTLVNPQDYFDARNVAIHGITEDSVKDAPELPALFDKLRALISGAVVAHHTQFDRTALARATKKYGLTAIECSWLDTARVVRRAWPEFARSGYGLSNVAEKFGIQFTHHAAHEDARASGEILRRAVLETGITITDWLEQVNYGITSDDGTKRKWTNQRFACEGNAEGPLFGETIVFTGELAIPRRHAAEIAAKAGCDVADGVNKHTTLLVVGDQDLRVLAGHEKSSKHRNAETLIEKGQAIRILCESDFMSLVETTAKGG